MDITTQHQGHDTNSALMRKEDTIAIGKADMFQLRHWIVEMVEELKVKRKTVVDAEARAELLAEQLLSLQIQKDGQEQAAKQKEQKLEQSMTLLKQECQDKLKAMDVRNLQYQTQRESYVYIQEKTRFETRQLKATIRQKDKQLHELEAQLQAEKSASSKLFSQWKDTEIKLEELRKLHQICQKSLARLEKAVSVACETNRRLSLKQEQHSSAMLEKTRQFEELEAQLVKARVRISEQPLEAVDVQRTEASMQALQKRIVQLEEDKTSLEDQLQQDWERRKKALSQLETAQSLVGQHLENASKNRQEADKFRRQCTDLIGQRDNVTQKLSDTEKQLEEGKQEFSNAREQWNREKLELSDSLSSKTHTLEMVQKQKLQLEDENVQITEERERLRAALQDAEAKLEVARTDQCIQIGCSLDLLFEASVQVRVESISIFTQTAPPLSLKEVSSQTTVPRLITTICQTTHVECAVTLGTQTPTLALVHIGTNPTPPDPLMSYRHVGLQTNLSKYEGKTARVGDNFIDKQSNYFPKNSMRKDKNNGKIVWNENDNIDKTKPNFNLINPLSSKLDDHRAIDGQLSRLDTLTSPAVEKYSKARDSLSERSMWQQMSSPQFEPEDAESNENGVQKVTDQGEIKEKLKSLTNDTSIKKELVDKDEKALPSFQHPTTKAQRVGGLQQNVLSANRVPKYPHLLFADSLTNEEVFDKNTSSLGRKSNEISDQQIETVVQSPVQPITETMAPGVELYQLGLTHIQRSRWSVYTKQDQQRPISKQSQEDLNCKSGVFNARSGAALSIPNTDNLNLLLSPLQAQCSMAALPLNDSIKIECTDQYDSEHLDVGENEAQDISNDESYNITSFLSPVKHNNSFSKDSCKKLSHNDILPKKRKVFKSLCLSRNGVENVMALNQSPFNVLSGSSNKAESNESAIVSGHEDTLEKSKYHEEQVKQWQPQTPQHKQRLEKQSLSRYRKAKSIEDDNTFHGKSVMECMEPNLKSTELDTSPSRLANRSIFKSSQRRPSLQETISAFKSSPRSRHLLGAPVSKLSNPRSRAVAKVNPLKPSSDSEKSKQRKEGTASRVTDHNSQASKNQSCKQSKGNNPHHREQKGKEQSPLFPPNITKLYGYSALKTNTLPVSSCAPKGILKAPQVAEGSFLLAKSVHFPAQLEIHMKGLTQESQESFMASQSQPSVQSMISMFGPSILSPAPQHLPVEKPQPLLNAELPLVKGNCDLSDAAHISTPAAHKESDSTAVEGRALSEDTTKSDSVSSVISIKDMQPHYTLDMQCVQNPVLANPFGNVMTAGLDQPFPNAASVVTKCAQISPEKEVPAEQKSTLTSDAMTTPAPPLPVKERPNLVIPETPNLSAVVGKYPLADPVQDTNAEKNTEDDLASTLPPDCKKLKLESP